MRLLPFAGRTRPTNHFDEQFHKIAAQAMLATGQLMAALQRGPDEALARIVEIEHCADQAVHEVHRLVDKTFIAPYDKRDIVNLAHRLDNVVDTLRTAVRFMVNYRVMEGRDAPGLAARAAEMGDLIGRSVAALKQVVDDMPAFDPGGVREAARVIDTVEHECDDLLAQSIQAIFPDPNQPVTAAMLAWQDIFRLLERTTDHCGHAMSIIVSIARQEGY